MRRRKRKWRFNPSFEWRLRFLFASSIAAAIWLTYLTMTNPI